MSSPLSKTIAIFDGNIVATGGMQRHSSELAHFFSGRDYNVVVVTVKEDTPYFSYPDNVRFEFLRFTTTKVEKFLSENAIDLAYLQTGCARSSSVTVAEAISRLVVPLIVCEHSDPSRYAETFDQICNVADAIHPFSQYQMAHVPIERRSRCTIIGHSIVGPDVGLLPADSERQKTVLYLGRFFPIKRIDLLIKAWAVVSERHCDWNCA